MFINWLIMASWFHNYTTTRKNNGENIYKYLNNSISANYLIISPLYFINLNKLKSKKISYMGHCNMADQFGSQQFVQFDYLTSGSDSESSLSREWINIIFSCRYWEIPQWNTSSENPVFFESGSFRKWINNLWWPLSNSMAPNAALRYPWPFFHDARL